jgi:hypothetical protein
MKEIVTDGQIIFSRAEAAVYMVPYGKAALIKLSFFVKLQNLKIRGFRHKINKILPNKL